MLYPYSDTLEVTDMPAATMPRTNNGRNPKSLANLGPRPLKYGEPKRKHVCSLTDTGWTGLQTLASALGFSSVTELLERLGRGEYTLSQTPPTPPPAPGPGSHAGSAAD